MSQNISKTSKRVLAMLLKKEPQKRLHYWLDDDYIILTNGFFSNLVENTY